MKYAFIIGSNAFIIPTGVISYSGPSGLMEILRIRSIYHDNEPGSFLSVDLAISDMTGAAIKLINNEPEISFDFKIVKERDSIKILRPDGGMIIHVHQLDTDSAMALEHNITAEFEVNAPIVVIRIYGDFKAGDLNISAENEKLFINDNGYATSAMTGSNQLQFTAAGVVL
jgi:hypothetical protein